VVAYTNSMSGTPIYIMSGDSPYTAQGTFSADSTAGDTTGLVIHSTNKITIGDGSPTGGVDVPMNTPLYVVARYTDLGGGTSYTDGGTTVDFSAASGSWTGPPAGLSIVTTAGAVSSGGSGSVFTLCSFIVTDGSSASAPAFGQPATPEQIAGDGSTTTFTTNYPFVEGTLQVFVGDVLVTPSSVNGATGSFVLPMAPDGTNIVVFYYGTGGTATGATNTTTLTAGPTHVPTSMLGSGTASATTFLRGDQTWAVPSGGSSSFGSNSNSVGSANAPGASSSNARADHVHQGVHQLTSNGSNALFENVNVAAGSGIALGVAGQTVTITNTGTSSGGAGGTGTLTTIEEVDGNPTDSAVTKLVFPNGTLAIASHVATYTPTGGTGSSIPEQEVPYPTSASGDDDLMASTAGWTDVGANAFSTFSSDGKILSLIALGASKTCAIRKTLGTTKAAAFDFRLGIFPQAQWWSSTTGDVPITWTFLDSGGTQIAAIKLLNSESNSTNPRFYKVSGAGSGAYTEGIGARLPSHAPLVLRCTRDGSNVVRFYFAVGSTPFALEQLRQTSTAYAPLTFTSSGTVARVEVGITVPAGPSGTAEFGAKLDFFVSA
jgi:hypothetical protein